MSKNWMSCKWVIPWKAIISVCIPLDINYLCHFHAASFKHPCVKKRLRGNLLWPSCWVIWAGAKNHLVVIHSTSNNIKMACSGIGTARCIERFFFNNLQKLIALIATVIKWCGVCITLINKWDKIIVIHLIYLQYTLAIIWFHYM